jgi:hypothetical protein
VVLYSDGKSTWNSGTGGLPTQEVGALYVYPGNGILVAEYASSTIDDPEDFWYNIPDAEATVDPGAPFAAVMTDNGNLEITRSDGTIIWSTNTSAQGEEG